jgi:hypothetical protein
MVYSSVSPNHASTLERNAKTRSKSSKLSLTYYKRNSTRVENPKREVCNTRLLFFVFAFNTGLIMEERRRKLTDDVKKALHQIAAGLKSAADELMSEPDMNPLDRQNIGIQVGLGARAIEMAIIADQPTPQP